jgi:predicted DNA-binding transcriptional regulator YafY
MPLLRAMIRFGGIDDVANDRVTMHFDSEEVARITLLGFGHRVAVIEPESLRTAIAHEAEELLNAIGREERKTTGSQSVAS